MKKTISKGGKKLTKGNDDDDVPLQNTPRNQAKIINNMVIDNLHIVHENPDATLPNTHSSRRAKNHFKHCMVNNT